MCLDRFYIREVTQCGPDCTWLVSGDTSDGGLPADRWARVLWFAAICDRGGACGSSNQDASVHRRAQSWRLGKMYLDCVHSTGDWVTVTGSPNSPVVSCYCVCSLVQKRV